MNLEKQIDLLTFSLEKNEFYYKDLGNLTPPENSTEEHELLQFFLDEKNLFTISDIKNGNGVISTYNEMQANKKYRYPKLYGIKNNDRKITCDSNQIAHRLLQLSQSRTGLSSAKTVKQIKFWTPIITTIIIHVIQIFFPKVP